MTEPKQFQWQRFPEAERWIEEKLDDAKKANYSINELSQELHSQTSTRLFDWVDHLTIPFSIKDEQKLEAYGFELDRASDSYRLFVHHGALFPSIVMSDDRNEGVEIAVSVESIADFLMVRGLKAPIEGTIFGGYRRCRLINDNNVMLTLVERRGTRAIEPTHEDDTFVIRYLTSRELWKSRPREHEDEDALFHHTHLLAQEIVNQVGKDMAASIILEVERDYWQSRNKAGQIQKNRQDRLGMGWANHDHHTFRSSRHHFPKLVRLFEIIGFQCRERFYAGNEAGWGAQVMENWRAGLVLFLDVDLAPEELAIKFAHHPLPERKKLGTIGLWCGLHGDSILRAGMHHLEAQFNFEDLKKDLERDGVQMMNPFSDFDYLKQAFTAGEIWRVKEERLKRLIKEAGVSEQEAEIFRRKGAIGSHLENLQRRDGYKGFNQKNVSDIIQRTDPRTAKSSILGKG